MQQINQNQSNINPNAKPFPLASEQVSESQNQYHASNAYEIFGEDVKKHRNDVNFTVELMDGSVWIPSMANLRVIAPVYQCIRLSDFLHPMPAPIILVSNGKHPSIGVFNNMYDYNLSQESLF